ncbi:probable folate-biopterin transporter 7 [Ziziphus jujuba]|uniref:Probable folate-biopterin transporter 7 n=1 Tax=Ziziphus jujuba TaxID=326968 RepID=A0A6P6FUQ0_ZIZJJ|nr:probable folate-biopterin transporter 7 [Ziziphus jujuba]XP_015869425.3 probable folate-biopterin transporter 7 [Ziziphus jujuba]XP_024925350.3 probable folate-biopterin transporter 7 [Ziziphus jujuba]XP_024925351.3 probable folate-biopterin transporter 7 [Ziziphus jujuba]XP_024925352.3 probable folate-biopterin transporter 7 [Ziziphus jujuba]XP_024925353.3 probable folate-biopterin transporter 7 [Ziziphus jujuba]XP_024925355.3 probable folate-biopterin transporter 7 [Ziziphus jujuba]XP_0
MGASDSEGSQRNPIRKVLGLGYWVQGFRCFPWMVVNFFLKDALHVHPSTLQLLQNSANLPMVAKPLFGILSDAVYLAGQHRIPYIAIGAILQAASWLAIATLAQSSISISTLTLFLLLSNLGASIAEVANDAIVAEAGKQLTSSRSSQTPSSGELQSFVWMASSAGGVFGNLLAGLVIDRFSPRKMFLLFGFLLLLQFFITITVRESSLNLPKSPPTVGIRKQLSELTVALKKPEIAYSVTWFAASNAIIPTLTGTMFFYQTQCLKIESSVLGISKVFGQAAMLLWSIIYDRCLKVFPSRKVISAIQAVMAVFMVSDVLFVKGIYRSMGMPDSLYVMIFSGLSEVLFFIKILPFSVLIARLCPPGCEGSLMAFVMSVIAVAFIVSGYLGVALASYVGVTGNNFSGFPLALLIQAICTLLPVYWSSNIPDDDEKSKNKNE